MSSSCYLLDSEYYYYSSTSNAAGGGGSTTRGGCGVPSNGTKYQGGAGATVDIVFHSGGGGGGGYYGGGGGGRSDHYGTPGGGGSSFLSNLVTFSLSQSGSAHSCNGQYSVYYNMSSCGHGGGGGSISHTGDGQNGLVVIRTSPLYSTFSPSMKPSVSPTITPSTPPPSIDYGQLLSAVNIFQHTGTLQSVTVPSGVSAIYVYMWGAGGANITMLLGTAPNRHVEGYPGGAGAYVEGTLPVTPGSSLAVLVGGGGRLFNVSDGAAHQGSFGGGGGCFQNNADPSNCQSYDYCFCAGGGGRSAIQLNGEDVLTAGGGGGGGWYGQGGAATSYSNGRIQTTSFTSGYGVSTSSCTHFYDAGGGSNTTGGCGHPHYGMKYQGGASTFGGGGGGGGYFGGGGGQGGHGGGGGGGGGSSYLNRLTSFSLSESGSISGQYCNGQYSSYFNATSCGKGNGQNGLVVITLLYSPTYSPATVSRRPTSPSLMPSLFPTTATATKQNLFASQSISGLNVSQYSSSSSYQTALVGTIVQAFTSPTINTSQVTNLLVSAGTSSGRRRLSASSSSIVVSYQIVLNSQFPVNAYSTQLSKSVESGTFSKNLNVNAKNAGAAGFANATSGSVSVAATPLVPTASPVSSPSSGNGSNFSIGAIIGIAVGAVVFLCLIGVAVWVYSTRRSSLVVPKE
mmetsp:Transcript_6787/g.9485  ORF Transcript_6787/g.9485 Transcript_6787/m.9485 type:complete len:680 (+) Transcript_6787:417-2456(+)